MRVYDLDLFDMESEIMLLLSKKELAVIVNALEDACLQWKEGSEIELTAQGLVLGITRVTGY